MFSSIRQRLVLLVLLVAIPLVAATTFVIYRLAVTQREVQQTAMLNSTRILAAAVDSEIQTYLAVGRTLALSQPLRDGDLAAFYQQAVSALSYWPNTWLALLDADDKQLLNTTRPFGEALPPVAHAEPHRRAMETREWQISDIYTGQVSRRQLIALYVPVQIGDRIAYDLVLALDPTIFLQTLLKQQHPPGWLSGIIDRQGNFVARTREHAKFVGRPGSRGWREAAKVRNEDTIKNISQEGEPLYSAYVNSTLSGWSVSIAATQAVLAAPFRRSLLAIGLSALGLVALSLAFAWWMGRRIVTPLVALEQASTALLRNQKISIGLTGLKEADQALRAFDASASALLEREEQFRTLADSIPQLAWMAEPDGFITWYNRRWYEYTGTTLAEMQGWGWRSVHDPGLVDGIAQRFRDAIENGEPWEDTFPLRGADGQYRWFLSRALPIRDVGGRVVRWFGTNTDVSQQKQAADRQRLLMNELNHRVKNTLAVIQSIAAITSRSASSTSDFSKTFISRIMGISRTHNVLTDSQWESAGLRDILTNELAPYETENAGRVELGGPSVQLTPSMAVDLGMIVHELATNAAKYGSLSAPDGKLKVTWELDWRVGGSLLRLAWVESGGPEVSPPSRTGFGSRLVAQTLTGNLGGTWELEYPPEGLRCSMCVPLPCLPVEGEAAE